MKYFPIAVLLKDKKVVVVGGGRIAERKVRLLIKAGANITVVSPTVTTYLSNLYTKGVLQWKERNVRGSDIKKSVLVIAATNDLAVNEKVSMWAQQENILVNVVDNKKHSTYISPAVVRHKEVLVTVYTDGQDPELSRDIKKYLKDNWDEFILYRNRS
ncbi:MAG: bifunctional precorrin-2 dehydrogenase/sirohydrochlorin ferrochelatase [Candidatus Ancaeobacter aquaticus]|nr:bifunctional precorrin-2 dehydrogenase/sirohydrochlorin ferrochelatase [Candidatus Ancaeobacter aquaticus]